MSTRIKINSNQPMCDKKCKSCVYRIYFPNPPHNVACYYAVLKGHSRPCTPGKNCTEYIKGRPVGNTGIVVSRGGLKRCKACGKEFMATSNNQRYCTSCYDGKRKAYKDQWYEKHKAIRVENELKVDKTCTLCGKTYHSESPRKGFCPDCKALPRYQQVKLKEQKNNG